VINPFFFLQFDSVGSVIGIDLSVIQTFPVIALISFLFLIFIWFTNKKLYISKVEVFLTFALITYLFLISTIEIVTNDWSGYFISGFFRQSVALLIFIAMYLMFRLVTNDYKYIFRGIYLGLILLIPIALFQVFNFAFGFQRLTGFSSEPSHFGHFLVFALIPSIIILEKEIRFKKTIFIFLNLLVLLTLSLTAIFQLLILYAAIFLNIGLRGVGFIVIGIVGLIYSISFIPESYLLSNLQLFQSLEAFEKGISSSASLADRVYSTLGPLRSLGSEISIFGHGISSDYYYFNQVIPYPANELIASVRGGHVGLSSFFGKVIMWGGLPLMIFVLTMFFNLYKNADKKIRKFSIPVFIASFYSLGSLASPYICLWVVILKISSIKNRSPIYD
jgi:hypothetical protein